MKYTTHASVVIVVLLTALVGIYIYLNPLQQYNTTNTTPPTSTDVPVTEGNFMQSLEVPITHSYESGSHVYAGVIGVPRKCTLQSGATLVGDQGDLRLIIGLKITAQGGGVCEWNKDVVMLPFSLQTSGSKPSLQGVTLNDMGVKFVLTEQ